MREALITLGDAEFATIGIADLMALCREAGIRDFQELACHGTGAVVQVELDDRLDEDELQALDAVDQWEHVAEPDDGHLYVIAFTAPGLSGGVAEQAADLVGTCDPEVGDAGATLSLVGPQTAIAGTIEEYQRDGVSPNLRRLGQYEGRSQPLDRLTDRQHEVIETAFDMGYYDVPRAVSTGDVAADLELDPSTVAEHLQRAERNLLSHLLASE